LRQDLHVAERDANVCGALCVKTCMLQSAMQMFVARFASRPAGCWRRRWCRYRQAAGLSTAAAKAPPSVEMTK